MILCFENVFSWVIGGITLCVSLVALVVVIFSYFRTKKELNKKIKEIQKNKNKE